MNNELLRRSRGVAGLLTASELRSHNDRARCNAREVRGERQSVRARFMRGKGAVCVGVRGALG